jgi:hypothetical protein
MGIPSLASIITETERRAKATAPKTRVISRVSDLTDATDWQEAGTAIA